MKRESRLADGPRLKDACQSKQDNTNNPGNQAGGGERYASEQGEGRGQGGRGAARKAQTDPSNINQEVETRSPPGLQGQSGESNTVIRRNSMT